MANHIAEQIFDTLFLTPDELGEEEKKNIDQHLDECKLCNEHYQVLKAFYLDLDKNLNSPPTERDRAFAEKLLAKKRLALPLRAIEKRKDDALDVYAEVIEPYYRSLPQRVIRYIQIHPVRAAAGFSMAAALVAVALMTFKPTKDANPAYAQAKDGFLIVNNKHGDELWRKYIGANFTMIAEPYLANHPERAISLQDVDGDETNELFCIFGWTGMSYPFNNLLVCYNADGTEKWKYEIHRNVKLGGVPYSDQYRFYHIEAGDFAHSGNVEIVAAARHDPWHPNVLLQLDGKTGKLVSEFWHPGMLREFEHKDLDHDGVDELVYAGQNNRLQHACLVVFDPRKIEGSAPAPEKYYPQGISAGTEKYYIIFPASDLKQFASDITNEVRELRITNDGMIEVVVLEPTRPANGTLYYYFDSSLNCIRVRASDSFTAAHNQMEREGKLSSHLNDEYFEALRKGVLYWDSEKFVSEPTMNKHYMEAMRSQPLP